MVFFGLTVLGRDRPLAVRLDQVLHLHVFEDEDWEAAWQRQRRRLKLSKQAGEEAGLPLDALVHIAETVYHGPVPAPDAALLEACVRRAVGEGDSLRKVPFLEAVRAARQEAEAQLRRQPPGPPPNNGAAKDAKPLGPRDKYTVPLTAQQEIGWEAARVRAAAPTGVGRKSSEETKFVSALLQHGMYYF